MTANFTGSLRLLTGLGWPMIFFIAFFAARRRGQPGWHVRLEPEHAIEVVGLTFPLMYFWVILLKGTLTLWDSAVLTAIYCGYLWTLTRIPPRELEDQADVPRVSALVLRQGRAGRWLGVLALFIGGGTILYLVAHPFLESMLGLAALLGVSQFVFVQWVSPFLSEFPEKVSAFNWARQVTKAPMGLMNMVSSNINQWTLLVAMIPAVYGLSLGHAAAIRFDEHQLTEIHLTMAQGYVGWILLLNMEFSLIEAGGLFVLWLVQLCVPGWREEVIWLYWSWFAIEVLRSVVRRRWPPAFGFYLPLLRKAIGPREPQP